MGYILLPGSNMSKKTSNPGKIHLRIVEVMRRFPEGITGGQIRQELEREGLRPEDQTHLDRRKRDLKKWFIIEKSKGAQIVEGKKRTVAIYKYRGDRSRITDEGQINQKLRAEVIHAAHGRCQMCGKTIEKHGISLVVDHKKPRDWGGETGLLQFHDAGHVSCRAEPFRLRPLAYPVRSPHNPHRCTVPDR